MLKLPVPGLSGAFCRHLVVYVEVTHPKTLAQEGGEGEYRGHPHPWPHSPGPFMSPLVFELVSLCTFNTTQASKKPCRRSACLNPAESPRRSHPPHPGVPACVWPSHHVIAATAVATVVSWRPWSRSQPESPVRKGAPGRPGKVGSGS